jgi:diacylglycerol kinase (ATP)
MLEREGLADFVVVVTRWYGGVHLGGDRFAHVATCVRALARRAAGGRLRVASGNEGRTGSIMQFLRAEARRFCEHLWSGPGRAGPPPGPAKRRCGNGRWSTSLSAALAFALDLTPAERALILALGLLVLAAELLNTAIEDRGEPHHGTEIHPLAKKAKDCGSAGVALAALAGGVAWLVVLAG